MLLKDAFIAELQFEYSLTRKMLERVPLDKKDWRPDEKSMTVGRLATHIAETSHWVSDVINIDDFDFKKHYSFNPVTASSKEELLQILQANLEKAIADLAATSDAELDKTWTVRQGDHIVSQIPKKAGIRGWAISHMIHHRGQLSVYLRLLGVPVPGMYGPSADERN
jgi:uncharacterized damage-inducible protein DinB